jgi:hypothetical protein
MTPEELVDKYRHALHQCRMNAVRQDMEQYAMFLTDESPLGRSLAKQAIASGVADCDAPLVGLLLIEEAYRFIDDCRDEAGRERMTQLLTNFVAESEVPVIVVAGGSVKIVGLKRWQPDETDES